MLKARTSSLEYSCLSHQSWFYEVSSYISSLFIPPIYLVTYFVHRTPLIQNSYDAAIKEMQAAPKEITDQYDTNNVRQMVEMIRALEGVSG